MKKQSNNNNNGLNVNLILIIQLVVMVILFILIVLTITKTTRQNSIEHMGTITDERAHIIENYVDNAEKTLIYFSKAEQVKALLLRQEEIGQSTDILKDTDSKKLISVAQTYTQDFSTDIDNLEGLWIGSWETHILTHSNAAYVGMTTRDKEKVPEKLQELQDAMLAAGSGVYDAGIIISPATGEQIISMYKAVYNSSGQPIGIVGLGIYTDELVEALDSMPIRGITQSFYSMVNVKDGNYIFNVDKSKIGQPATNEEIVELCSRYKNAKSDDTGNFEYDADGDSFVSIYSYMADHGWILMIDDTKSEVFSLTRNLRIYLNIFGLCVLGLMLLFHFINKKQQKTAAKLSSQVEKNAKTKDSLNKAVFQDILTGVNNRIAFSIDMDKQNITATNPRYFALFNIRGFSSINTKYGNDAGDSILVSTVDALKKFFKSADIYRTGSDEFVLSIPVSDNSISDARMKNNVAAVVAQMSRPQSTASGYVTPYYKYSLVKKTSAADSSVVTVLKDLAERATSEEVQFVDMG